MDDPERFEASLRVKFDSATWAAFLAFLWLATLLALVLFLREKGADWTAAVYFYAVLSIGLTLSGGKRLLRPAVGKIKAALHNPCVARHEPQAQRPWGRFCPTCRPNSPAQHLSAT